MTQNQQSRFTARSLPPRGQKNNQPRNSQASKLRRRQRMGGGWYPPPPLQSPPPCKVPPPPGHRHFHLFLVNMNCAGLCCPSALRMALHCFPSTTNQAKIKNSWCTSRGCRVQNLGRWVIWDASD